MKRNHRRAAAILCIAAAVAAVNVGGLRAFGGPDGWEQASAAGSGAAEAGEAASAEASASQAGEAEAAAAGTDEAGAEAEAEAAEAGVDGSDAAAAPGSPEPAQPEASGRPKAVYPVSATTKAAENERYILYGDPKSGNIRIVSKASGAEWLGTPQADRTTTPSNKKFMDSPVQINYTEGSETTSTYPLKEKGAKIALKPQKDGLRADFDLPSLKLRLSVVYTLTEDGLTASIPDDSIVEGGSARLVSVELLPFFNAARGSDEGAILIPDGSGALIAFKEKHAPYYAGYSEPIYGPDLTFKTQSHDVVEEEWLHRQSNRERIALPVFGIYRNGVGSLGIVAEGEFAASINATPSGIRNIPFYRSGAEFVYRNDDVIFVGSTGRVPLFQAKRIEGDRSIAFKLLEGEEAGYPGMARAYRDYLIREKGVQPIRRDAAPFSLKLFGGILRDEVIGDSFVAMTSFDEAQAILDALAERGVRGIDATLSGWSAGGRYGDQPRHFPASGPLGGGDGLKRLTEHAAAGGSRIYLEAHYAQVSARSDGLRKSDAVRGLNRDRQPLYEYFLASGWNDARRKFYMTKPQAAYDRYLKPELAKYAAAGAAGAAFAGIGESLYSDQAPDRYLSRGAAASVWRQMLEDSRSELGAASVSYGFAYTLGAVDRIEGAPMDSSHFLFADETVPFYQMALHGLIPYTAPPTNLRDDAAAERLRMLEYGAIPSYELTFKPTSALQRTDEDRLFSSGYEDWLDEAAQEYKDYAAIASRTMGEAIVDHEKLSRYVYRTTYEGGTQVWVNYGSEPAAQDGVAVPPMDYVVTEGASR
ncbi:hypothetical protein B8V81_4901 [Paenibacillus pasadenensis]|uniref:Uncharacterized protein n=1 Tax=Paenibacillus pasadenensis TaxID=217090 RepID=A0A2N5N843_9BACL|nr:DUF5696 domain-containing protein [Paenibacillus pasadenensis]PLT46470.1 hypothetical protein B8V81_4901 [Paenibacillus pasadenensis]